MSDTEYELPDKDPATIKRHLNFLGLTEGVGVDVDPIPNMIAIPAVLDKDGDIITPAEVHKGGHYNLRLSGQAALDDITQTPSGSRIKDLMTADRGVKNYSKPTRPTTVRNAPIEATLIENIEHPQRRWM